MQLENKHKEFKEKIYKKNYDALDNLYIAIVSAESELKKLELATAQIKIIKIEKNDNHTLSHYQLSIQYLRICSMVKGIITELAGDGEKTKQIVNYYMDALFMNELNFLGLSWYYDIKFYKDIHTVYSAGKIAESTWNEWLKNSNLKDNMIKDNILQTIMKACKEHINRGGIVKLMSFSKCFGIDLYKFMYLDNDKKSYLNIVMKTQTNILKIKDKKMSISEYRYEELSVIPDFFFDFSEVRIENNISNLNTWFKHFLNQEFISQKEVETLKEDLKIWNNTENEWLAYYFLKEKRQEEGKKGISSRINPIKDREVVANNLLWDTIEYDNCRQKEDLKPDVMYSFELNEDEFMKLIYEYYYKLYIKLCTKKKKGNHFGLENYFLKFDDRIKNQKEEVLKQIEKTELEIKELKSNQENRLQDGEIERKIYEKSNLKNIMKKYSNFLENTVMLKEKWWVQSSDKVNVILSMIDWEYELISKTMIQKLTFQNIYQWDLNSELKVNNLFINLFKEICKGLCFSEAGNHGK